ncbi:MAG: glycosyltransferase [Phycisphaeraceae bacterium]|nr:glycosyltransferase [Phycisphaeraceae bacterium]
MPNSPNPIRVRIQQPALPAYRVPVFAELARRPGLSVEVLYSDRAKVPNVQALGFSARAVRERRLLGWPREVRWVPAQFMAVDPAHADVAVLEYNSGVPSLVPAIRKAKRRGVGVVVWGHGYSIRDTGPSRRLRNWIGRQAHAILLYHHHAREMMISEGMDPERLFVAQNALDQAPIQTAREHWLSRPDELERFRRDQGIEGARVVLFVSRLIPDNRTDLLLHAASSLMTQVPDLVVAIVGDGQQRAELEALAARLGIGDRVRFTGAIYGEQALAPWFLSSMVFCYPSSLGLSVLHAMGYGLPVVTSSDMSRQMPEAWAVVDGKNGLLVDLGQPASLAGALGRVLTDEQLRERLARGAHQTALERYTLANMVDGYEAAVRYAKSRAKRP